MKSDTVAFFDQAAGRWDQNINPSPERIERLLDLLGAIAGGSVLDIGCGTGILFPSILERTGQEGHLTGLDPSGEMLRKARRNCHDPSVVLLQGFAESIPTVDGIFDAVILFSCYPHLADPAKAIAECNRVLTCNGRILIGHASGREQINRIHRKIGGAVAGHILAPASTLAGSLTSGGFEVATVIDEEDIYCVTGTKNLSR